MHANQSYSKFLAKSDKVHNRELSVMIRNTNNINRSAIDYYGLLHASLYTIQETTKKPGRCHFKLAILIHLEGCNFLSGVKALAHFFIIFKSPNKKLFSTSILFFRTSGMAPLQRTRNLLLKLSVLMKDSLYSVARIF